MKQIKIIVLLLIMQVAVFAQGALIEVNTVNYEYDASGNRVKRRITVEFVEEGIAPTKNILTDIPTVTEDINKLIAANNQTPATLKQEVIQEGANGIATITEGDIKVFPNPVQDKLNVQFTGTATAEGCSLQLYDGAAKLFYKEGSMQNLTEVNMQQAQAGVYYLVVQTKEGKRLYWKVVKQ